MSDNFKCLSINVRGNIKNAEHKNKILSCVRLYNINVLLLQETHVSDLSYKKDIDKEFDCVSYWSFGSTDSRGVAIFIMNNFERDIVKFNRDLEGRAISVKLSSHIGNLNIVSIYAPNNILWTLK